MHQIIQDLNWRYATKKYDSNKKISNKDLDLLKEAMQLTASSFGLQPYHIFIIENPDLREKLKEVSFGQTPVSDASHLVVFCAKTDISDEFIQGHVNRSAKNRNVEPADLSSFGDYMKTALSNFSAEQKLAWTSKQCYIVLGELLHTAAHLNIDSTPMEGFIPTEYDRILGLEEKGLHAVVSCAIGYRSEDDPYQHLPKTRREISELIELI